MRPKPIPLSTEAHNEIERFKRELQKLDAGSLDDTDFKRFRLNNGIYGIRGSMDEHMVRIKVPFGNFNADQLDAVAEVADKLSPTRLLHVTTRQAIQIHNIKRRNVPALLEILNHAGLTTREACGNTVRNVSCDQMAGLAEDEVFDPQPYADLVHRYFLRNPICQTLPRKFKIAFEGCPTSDRARIAIHDLGFRAKTKEIDGKRIRGFETTVGGGLGSMPFPAQLLEDFTPVEALLPTAEAVIRIFDRHGNRRDRNRARIKFIVAAWGIEEFRKVFENERRVCQMTSSGRYETYTLDWKEETAPKKVASIPQNLHENDLVGFDDWISTNVIPQKQKGYRAVYIRCYLGDMNPEEARAIGQIARDFGGGHLRTTITQNLLLPWIPESHLQAVYARLLRVRMALPHAQYVADITRCPGADTCNLAVTHSKGLARDITEKVFSNGYSTDPVLKDLTIKISGCTNSCGQHHIADIGFYGGARNYDGKSIPHYQLLIGGRTGLKTSGTHFGERVAQIPARRVHEVVKHILDRYKEDRKENESFSDWNDRKGLDYFKKEVVEFQSVEPIKSDPNYTEDLGDQGNTFAVKVGKGECAA